VLLLPAVLAGGQGGFLEAVGGRGGGRASGGACPQQHSSGSLGQNAWWCLQQQQEQEQQLSEPCKGTWPPSQVQQARLHVAGTAYYFLTSVPLVHSVQQRTLIMALMSMMGVYVSYCSAARALHLTTNLNKLAASSKPSWVLCVHFMQAPLGDVMTLLAVEELAGPRDGAPSVAADATPDNTDASVVQV